MVERMVRLWTRIVQQAEQNQYHSVLLVSHGSYIRQLLQYLLDRKDAKIAANAMLERERHPANTSVTIVEFEAHGEQGLVTQIYGIDHLERDSEVYCIDK